MANINEIGLAIARKQAEEYRKNAHKSEVKTYIPQAQGKLYSDAGYLANRVARGAAQLGAGVEDMGRFSIANKIDAAETRNNLKGVSLAERYEIAKDASFGSHKWEKGKGFGKNLARQAANLAEWNKHKVFDNSPASTMTTDSFYGAVANGIAARNGGDTEAAYSQMKDKAIGEESWVADKTNLEEWGQKLDADKDRHGKGVQVAGSVTEAAPTIMAAIAASLIPGDANVAAYGLMGAATGGNTAREAYRGGADITEAVAAGAMAGLSEIVTEKITGGIWRFGKGLIDKPISYIAGKISKPWVSKFVKYIAGSLGEGAEEILTEEMQYQIESGVWNNEAERLTAKEYLEVFGVGAILSLVFGTHVFFDSKGKMHVEEEPKQEETTNEASSDQQGTSSEQQAEDKSREEEKEKRFWQRVEEISLDNPTITWTDKQMQAVYDMVEREMAAESNSTLYSTGSVVSEDPNAKQYALPPASVGSQNETAVEIEQPIEQNLDSNREEEKQKRILEKIIDLGAGAPSQPLTERQMQAIVEAVEREMATEGRNSLYSNGFVVSEEPMVRQQLLSPASVDRENAKSLIGFFESLGYHPHEIVKFLKEYGYSRAADEYIKSRNEVVEGFNFPIGKAPVNSNLSVEEFVASLRNAGYDEPTIKQATINVFGKEALPFVFETKAENIDIPAQFEVSADNSMGSEFGNIKKQPSQIAKTKIKATEGFTPESLYSALRLAGYDDATINNAMVNIFGENQFSSPAAKPAAESAAPNNEATQAEQATEQQGVERNLADEEVEKIMRETEAKNMTSIPDTKSKISVLDRLRMELETDSLFSEKLAEETNNPLINSFYHYARSSGKAADYALGGKDPGGKAKGAQYDSKGNVVGGSLAGVFEAVDKKAADAVKEGKVADGKSYREKFYNYTRHLHNVSRYAKKKPVFGFTSGIDSETSKRVAEEYEKQFPEFAVLAEKIYDFNNNNLQMYVDAKIITEAEKNDFIKKYPYYVPTFRDESQVEVKKRGKYLSPGLKRATGGRSPMIDLGGAIAQQTATMYQKAAVNMYGLQLLNTIETAEGSVKAYVDSQMRIVDIEPNKVNIMGLAEDENADISELSQFSKSPDGRNSTLTVYRDGQKYRIELSEGMAKAVEALTSGKTPPFVLRAIGKATGTFRDLVTKYNPTFPVMNLARDMQGALLYSKNPAAFSKNIPGTIKEIVSNGEEWKLYQSMGGFSSSLFDIDSGVFEMSPQLQEMSPQEVLKYYANKVKEPTLGTVENFNIFFEQLMRFNEFRTTIQKAGNTDFETLVQALHDSAEVTLNFNRSGAFGRAINMVTPFFNAGVQGISRGARFAAETAKSKDVAKILRVVAYATMSGVAPEILFEMIYGNNDDEEIRQAWEETSSYYKNGYYLIWNGDAFFRIPKGRMQGVLSALTNIAIDIAKGEDVTFDSVKDEIGPALNNLMPPSPTNGNIFSPLTRAKLFNPDDPGETWYGGDIETYADQQKLPYERYDSSTSDIFIKIAEAIAGETGKGISPKKLQTIFEDYFGAVGDMIVNRTDSEYDKGAIQSKFTVDPTFQNTLSSDFYDLRDKYSDTIADSRSTKDKSAFAVIMEAYLNEVNSQISTLRDEQKKIQDSSLSQRAKEEKMEEYQEQINELMRTAIEKEAEYSGKESNYYEELKEEVTSTAKYQAFSKDETEKADDLIEDYAKYVILDDLGVKMTEKTSVEHINGLVDAGFSDADSLIIVSDMMSQKGDGDKRQYLYDSSYTDQEIMDIVEVYGLASDRCNEVWGEAESLNIPYRKYLEAFYIIYSNKTGYKKAERIADVKSLGIDGDVALELWDMIRNRD